MNSQQPSYSPWLKHFRDWKQLYWVMLWVTTAMSMCIGVFIAYQAHQQDVHKHALQSEQVKDIASIIEHHLWVYDFDAIRSITKTVQQNDYILRFTVVDAGGLVIANVDKKNTSGARTEMKRYVLHAETSKAIETGYIDATMINDSAHFAVFDILKHSALYFAIIFLPSVLLVFIYTHHFLAKPLDKLSHAIDETINHGSPTEVTLAEDSRFGRFADQFNQMQRKLDVVQTGLTSSLSKLHEKTALAEWQEAILNNVLHGIGMSISYFGHSSYVPREDIGDTRFSIFKLIDRMPHENVTSMVNALVTAGCKAQIVSGEKSNNSDLLYEIEVMRGSNIFLNVKVLAIKMGGLAIVSMDVSQAKILETNLRQAQKLEAVGLLTSGIAHDLNNLLTIIMNSYEVLALSQEGTDTDAVIINTGLDTTKRASKLVSSLLHYSRHKSSISQHTTPKEIVAHLLEIIPVSSLGTNIVFDVVIDNQHTLNVDTDMLQASLINLIFNARDAIKGKGKITLEISNASPRMLALTQLSPQKNYTQISVIDTGSGIPLEIKNKILNPFYTTKSLKEGTGLGLAMVYGFAKQNKGELVFANNPKLGATFTLLLPAAKVLQTTVADSNA